jgi:hypothetical protein
MTIILAILLMHISFSVIIKDIVRYENTAFQIYVGMIPSVISLVFLGILWGTPLLGEIVESCIIAASIFLYVIGVIKVYLKIE